MMSSALPRTSEPEWWLYRGTGPAMNPADRDRRWPPPPPRRAFTGSPDEPPPPEADPQAERRLGAPENSGAVDHAEAAIVNAAIHLRRPLLVTGPPGSGRSTLAYKIARELRLGRVLRWQITTQSTLRSGLSECDPVERAYARRIPASGDAASIGPDVDGFIQLGPLGTALLPYRRPRVLLIQDLDQCDIDLPYELSSVFDGGGFEVPELVRARDGAPRAVVRTDDAGRTATIRYGRVQCHEFPLIVMTSGDDREFPPRFRQECLHLRITEPDDTKLLDIVSAHFPDGADGAREVIAYFRERHGGIDSIGIGQLLDAVHLRQSPVLAGADPDEWNYLLDVILQATPPAVA